MRGADIAAEWQSFAQAGRLETYEAGQWVGEHVFSLLDGRLMRCRPESGSLAMEPVDVRLGKRQAMSKEEEMLRERLRTTQKSGIDSFTYEREAGFLLLGAHGSIYKLNVETLESQEIPAAVPGARLFSTLSADGKMLGFVRSGNLFLTDVATGAETQVNESRPNVLCGAGDFVHQEEFSAYRSYWISPDTSGSYRILYLEFDETQVDTFNIPNAGILGGCDAQRYPRTGSKNSIVSCYCATLGSNGSVTREKIDLDESVEYVSRGGWSQAGDYAFLSVVNRLQNHVRLLKIDFQSAPRVLYEEKSETFINASEDMVTPLHFFKDGKILICSERSQYAHLHLLDPDSGNLSALTSGDSFLVSVPKKWSPGIRNLWFDDEHEIVYFVGEKMLALESHLFALNRETGQVTQLTKDGCSHDNYCVGRRMAILEQSSLTQEPKSILYKIADAPSLDPKLELVTSRDLRVPKAPFLSKPKLFSIDSNGFKLFGLMYLPREYDATKKYPTVVYTYGGPHAQLVRNSYSLTQGPRCLKWQYLASKGYVVSVLDNRGSPNRGAAFESEIYKKMGVIDIDDQVLHVKHLVDSGVTDPERVAIYGASYGGYMTLLALSRYPNVFKLGFSFSPVSAWEAYDTGYTERYMSLPELNPEGYKQGSVLTHASGFPDEPGRLVIFHGLMDENVHFCHTTILAEALIRLNKPYSLQIYPDDRHGVARGAKHSTITMFQHLFNHL